MKNHEYRNGRIIQTNKKFSHLKQKQKEWISNLLREKYQAAIKDSGKKPSKQEKARLLQEVYNEIEEREIWLPYHELKRYFDSKLDSYKKNIQ